MLSPLSLPSLSIPSSSTSTSLLFIIPRRKRTCLRLLLTLQIYCLVLLITFTDGGESSPFFHRSRSSWIIIPKNNNNNNNQARKENTSFLSSSSTACLDNRDDYACIDSDGDSDSDGTAAVVALNVIPRGGGGNNDNVDHGGGSSTTTTTTTIMHQVRNTIASLLRFQEKHVPWLAKVSKGIILQLERLVGQTLLPTPKKKKKRKKKKKSSTSKSIVQQEEEEEEEDSIIETTKRKKTPVATNAEEEQPSSNKQQQEQKKKKKTKSKKKKTKSSDAASSLLLKQKINTQHPNYRIQRELKEFIKSPPPNLKVKVGKNIRVWIVVMVGAERTIYDGEVFRLRVSFPPQYPMVPPSVYFLPPHMPQHEHVYTNGDICLSLLGKDWRPTMTAQSIAVSILSILSSARAKELPMDNARHAGNKPGQPQDDWIYHDDNC